MVCGGGQKKIIRWQCDGGSTDWSNRVRVSNCYFPGRIGRMGWCMIPSQITASDEESLEYLNVLVTVELAAEIHRNKPNTAIRKTVARLLPRMNHPRVKAIMVGLARQAYPSG